ncbi:hypothetical protein FIBSPDRAFT_363313 [Athelia psychrophila]|uniref:Uncharacterized protein n=1 Tax=Athelia psychrophila TaxID=1759441 RepID=A0A166PEX1_9AGAM|nr:hypothetical protein FIBSPDRAFT_363313 [Fibularhizoctonia sp. CBS 109695]
MAMNAVKTRFGNSATALPKSARKHQHTQMQVEEEPGHRLKGNTKNDIREQNTVWVSGIMQDIQELPSSDQCDMRRKRRRNISGITHCRPLRARGWLSNRNLLRVFRISRWPTDIVRTSEPSS